MSFTMPPSTHGLLGGYSTVMSHDEYNYRRREAEAKQHMLEQSMRMQQAQTPSLVQTTDDGPFTRILPKTETTKPALKKVLLLTTRRT